MANEEIKKLSINKPLKEVINKYFNHFLPYNSEQREYMWERIGLPSGYDAIGEVEYGTLIVNMKTRELYFSEESTLTI